MRMRTFICALTALFLTISAQAAVTPYIRIWGSPTWSINNSTCTFKLAGSIQNPRTDNLFSGPLRMSLWASTGPSLQGQRYLIAEHPLGPLFSGGEIGSFTANVPAVVPELSGSFYFTITLLESTNNGVTTQAIVTAGEKLLEGGEFVTGSKWTLPNRPVIAPPAKFTINNKLTSTLKATEELSLISLDSQTRTVVAGAKGGMANVSAIGNTTLAKRGYSVRKSVYYDKKVKVGRLFLNYAPGAIVPWNTTYTLYFHSKKAGTYKSVEVFPKGGRTSWGTFSFK